MTTKINSDLKYKSGNVLGLLGLLERNANQYADYLFWEDLITGQKITHFENYRNANWVIEKLKSKGYKKGQTICFVLSNSRYFISVLTACIELGLILVPIEEDRNEIENVIHSVHPKILLHTNEVDISRYEIPAKIETISIEDFMSGSEKFKLDDIVSKQCNELKEFPALLIKTSGTTGQSKFVELCEKNLAWNGYCLQQRFQCSHMDRFMCTLPWSHMNAIMITGCFVLNAASTVVWNNITKSLDPISSIINSKASVVSLTPTLIAFLLKRQKEGQNLKHIKLALCGAAPLSAELWETAERKLECEIHQGYGLSETTCWITASLSGREEGYNNVGSLLVGEVNIDTSDNLQVITRNDTSEEMPEVLGEIQYKGPILMCGYRTMDGKRSFKLTKDGYFNTGDVGYIDSNDHIHVIGRSKEIIIRSGINVVPESIDSIVRQHPAIQDSKTIGISDDLLGEQIITAYILRPDAQVTDVELRRYVSDKLPRLFIPNKFTQISELPKNRVGKIAILDLRKIVSGEFAQAAFDAINTWKFKREQPEYPNDIVDCFQRKILLGYPLEFVCYWGIGTKDCHSSADIKALERLKELLQCVTSCGKISAQLHLLMTDVHALINGKPKDRVYRYLEDIESLGQLYGFNCTRTSKLWDDAGLSIDEVKTMAKETSLEALVEKYKITSHSLNRLKSSAGKHVEYSDNEYGLKCYLLSCFTERNIFAEIYAGCVFLTYNDEEMDFLTPPLPTFAISSYQKGTAIKPWFCTD